MRARIAALIDCDRIEPREFWRRAFHEAMRESSYDPNPLIDAIFDADTAVAPRAFTDDLDLINAHISALAQLIRRAADPAMIATAATLLAVCLGYSPAEAINPN